MAPSQKNPHSRKESGDFSICEDNRLILATLRTLTDDYSLIEETRYPLISFEPFALADVDAHVTTHANGTLLPLGFALFARKAENPVFLAALEAMSPDNPLEILFLGAGVMLDGQLHWNHPAVDAFRKIYDVGIVGIFFCSDLFPGVGFELG